MPPKRRIQLLPEKVANMIAAGEVVERPASVLKELMENSIDAGATQIDVEVSVGGRKLVAVSDNGWGMSRDDALLSIERHATSKIRDVADIESIATLGFRGEALAATASVCRFTLRTRSAEDAAGTEVAVSGGKVLDVREVGSPVGTRVEVRDLFFNVPARRKFLRSEQTELAHLRQCVVTQALAHPAVGMRVTVDGRQVSEYAAGAAFEDRLRDVFGADYSARLRKVSLAQPGVAVRGYIGIPALSRSDRGEQFFFVNSRPTGAPLLNYAVREAYRTLVPENRHPPVFLFVDIDPDQLDVNVHPTKREVRFRKPSEVRDAVIEAVRRALAAEGERATTPVSAGTAPGGPDGWPAGVATGGGQTLLPITDLPPSRSFRFPSMPMIPTAAVRGPADRAQPAGAGEDAADVSQSSGTRAARSDAPWAWCRVLGQIGGLYVLLETEDGFVVMDPHAAHERILFERFMSAVASGTVESQGLLSPETVELLPADAQRVRRNMDLFRQMGFGLSEFGGDTFVVDAMPGCLPAVSAQILLTDIAQGLDRAGGRGGAGRWQEEAIARAACSAAVKARDRMTLAEIERLVIALAGTEMPYTCPHGRPTLIYTSIAELHRKFGRTQGGTDQR